MVQQFQESSINQKGSESMNTKELDARLHVALVAYDRKQECRKGYDLHDLSIYLERLEAVMADIESGTTPRQALLKGFNDRLLDVCLVSIGEPKFTKQEQQNAPMVY